MTLMKKPQFLLNQLKLWVVVFTKFHDNWAKMVDFSLIAYLDPVTFFIPQSLIWYYNLKSF